MGSATRRIVRARLRGRPDAGNLSADDMLAQLETDMRGAGVPPRAPIIVGTGGRLRAWISADGEVRPC